MSKLKLKSLLEGYAWERNADGSLPTLKDAITTHAANIAEKAESTSQQQAAGIALAVKRGKLPKSALQGASKEMYNMSEDELEKFAGTKHAGLPKHVEEDVEAELNMPGMSDDETEVDETAKPDYIDLDGDGDETETMKHAAHDKEMQAEGEHAYKNSSNNELASHIGQLKNELDAEKDPKKRKLIQQDLDACKTELDSRKQNEGLTQRDLNLIAKFKKNLNSARRY